MSQLVLVFTVLILSSARAENVKLDLKERLQYHTSATGVAFEYCNLNKCEHLSPQPIPSDRFAQERNLTGVPTGIARQLLANASPNVGHEARSPVGVAGTLIGHGQISRAVCTDTSIVKSVTNAKTPADYVMPYVDKSCDGYGANQGSIKSEAEILRSALKKMAQ